VLLISLVPRIVDAKEWHGIVPFKSTRSDVARILGPQDNGSYATPNERIYIRYSEGPCSGLYQSLRKPRCECMLPKDTVISISVVPTNSPKFSSLKIDKSQFIRELDGGSGQYNYTNANEGVRYRVDESLDDLLLVEYSASATDCGEVIRTSPVQVNSWRHLVPLHSTRAEVERLLGAPDPLGPSLVTYETPEEGVLVRYAKTNCSSGGDWDVPVDTVLEIQVTLMTTMLLDQLDLDFNKYLKVESPHPENVFYYMNREDGILIETRLRGQCETVRSIRYSYTKADSQFLCKKRQ